MKKLFLLLNLLLIMISSIQAQVNLDSLRQMIKDENQSDSARAEAFYELSYFYRNSQYDSSRYYALKNHELGQTKNYQPALSLALVMLGYNHYQKKEYDAAEDSLQRGISLSEVHSFEKGKMLNLFYFGYLKIRQKLYEQAEEPFQQSMEAAQNLNDSMWMSKILYQFGRLYRGQNQSEQALKSVQQSLDFAKNQKDTIWTVTVLVHLGYLFTTQNQPDQALQSFQRSLDLAESQKDTTWITNSLLRLGYLFTDHNQPDQALQSFQQILNIAEKQADTLRFVQSSHEIGLIYSVQANYEQAIAYYEPALDYAEMIRDSIKMKGLINSIGVAHMKMENGDLDQALDFYRRSLAINYAMKDSLWIDYTFDNMAIAFDKQKNYDSVLHYKFRSLEMAEKMGNAESIMNRLTSIGKVYNLKGEYTEAIKVYERGLEIAESTSDWHQITLFNLNIGVTLKEAGEIDQAKDFFECTLGMSEEFNDLEMIYPSILNLGTINSDNGNYQEALKAFQRSYNMSKELGDREQEVVMLNNLGVLYVNQNNFTKALEYYERSYKLNESLEELNPPMLCLAYQNIAEIYVAKGDLDKGEEFAKKTLKLSEEYEMKQYKARALATLAKAHMRRDELKEAEVKYLKGLAIIDDQNTETEADIYINLCRLAHIKGDYKRAVAYGELSLTMSQEMGKFESIRNAAEFLWESQKANKQLAKALETYQLFIEMRDSAFTKENQRALIGLEYREKALQDSLASIQKQREIEVSYEQELAQRNYLLFGGLGAALIAVLGFYFWQQKRTRDKELTLQKERNERLEQIDKLKDQFLANTSHELRTPLQGIIGLSESWQEKTEDEALREDLSLITSSGKRLANLVNDILDFSKLQNFDIDLLYRPLSLRVLADVVLRNHAPLIKGKDIALDNEISVDLAQAYGDENRIQQVLYNLIGNAIKFTESGYIKVNAEEQDGMIQISVEDTGVGIPEEKREAIFQEFQQADGSISREFAGTGLGLSISKKLIELHGGRMWVESEVGQGSTFFFSLPISLETGRMKTSEIAAMTIDRESIILEKEMLQPLPIPIPADSVRILVVDDEPINQQVLKNHLSGQKFQLFQAMNGLEAIALIEEQGNFDLVLLDVMMPRMSGYEVCQKIREKYLASELPIIMITAKNQLQDIVEGLSVGANDYLPKPFHKDELLARVKTQLDLHNIFDVAGRFVPNEFLHTLNHDRLTDVSLGDYQEREVTVMFTDIRGYTTLAEGMSPEDTFRFVNAFHGRMGPIIQQYQGFVNQYLGDGIMAIFPSDPALALQAAVDMQRALQAYNQERELTGRQAIKIGIGLHTGPLIMGIIGDQDRLDAATISDTVNTAARIESLTKHYGASILISEDSLYKMGDQAIHSFQLRNMGKVQMKGKKEPVELYECYDGDLPDIRMNKQHTIELFQKGFAHFFAGEFSEASDIFEHMLEVNPSDHTTSMFLEKARKYLEQGMPEGWTGVEVMNKK